MKHLFALMALAAYLPYAAAQQRPATPNPADPAAQVPQTRHKSAFTGYSPYREQDVAGWRDLNDEVARIGGHIKMFGGAGHGAKPGPAKPASGQPASSKDQTAGQPPARKVPETPQAPQGADKGH